MEITPDTLEKYESDYELLAAFQDLSESEAKSGFDSDEVVQKLTTVGVLLNQRGEYLEALGYFIRARGILEAREEQLHPLMSDLLAGIGEHYLIQGMMVEALPYYQKSLSVREALCIGETADTAHNHMKAGEILCMQGELVDAKEHMLRAYQILQNLPDEDNDSFGEVNHNLGIILMTEEYYERAIDYLTEAEKRRAHSCGEASLERADTQWALGQCYLAISNQTKALDYLYRSIAIREECLGSEHDTVHESKRYYREVSSGTEKVTETTLLETSQPLLERTSTELLLQALLAATSVALQQGHYTTAQSLIVLCRECCGGGEEVDEFLMRKIMSVLEEHHRANS